MTELVTRNYWQLGVTKDVGKYVKDCDMYQRIKNRTEVLIRKLKLSKVSEKLQTYLTVDFIIKLPLIAGKDVILVVCNKLSKMTHFVATTEGISAEGLVRLFRDNIWKLHRLPESIVSDKELQFAVEMTKELNSMLGIKTKLLTAFHPQTDSQIERINQKLEQCLRFFVDYRQNNWPEQLVSAEFAINNKAYLTTKVSLFMVNYRREMRIEIDLRKKEKIEKVTEFVERMRKIQEEAGTALTKAQEGMKRQADKERKKAKVWRVGNKIMLSTKNLIFKK